MLDSALSSMPVAENGRDQRERMSDIALNQEQYAQRMFCFAAESIHMVHEKRRDGTDAGIAKFMLTLCLADLQITHANSSQDRVDWLDMQSCYMGVIGTFAHIMRACYPGHGLIVPAPWASYSSTLAPPIPFWSSELSHAHSWLLWLRRYVSELCSPSRITEHAWTMVYEHGMRVLVAQPPDRNIRFAFKEGTLADDGRFVVEAGLFQSTAGRHDAMMWAVVHQSDGRIRLLKKYRDRRIPSWNFDGIMTPFGICGIFTWVGMELRWGRTRRGYFWLCKQECSEPAWPLSPGQQTSIEALNVATGLVERLRSR